MKRSKVIFDEKKPYKCELCGEWVEKYKETNLCSECGSKVITLKNKNKVSRLTKFARWCTNIGSVMLFTGFFGKIWFDSDFVQRYCITGLFLILTAFIIYFLQSIAEEFEKRNK